MLPQVFRLTQPSAAVAKDIHIRTGWRPALVVGLDSVSGSWYKADGRDDATEHVITHPDGGANSARVDNVCKLTADGFTLGSNATYVRANGLVMTIIAYPPAEQGLRAITLDDSSIGDYSAQFGAGTQYDATDQGSPKLDWISTE